MMSIWHRLSVWLERFGKKGRVAAIFILLLPLIIASSFNLYWTWHDLTQTTLARRLAIAELAGVVLKEKFDHLTELGVSLATRVRFRDLVNEGKWSEAIQIMTEIPATFIDIERLFLTDTNGVMMAQTPDAGSTIGKNFSYRDWYKGVSQNWSPYVSEIYKRSAEPQLVVVAIAIPIRNKTGVTGIMVLQVRISAIVNWLANLNTESTSIYFVDKRGNVAGHPGATDEKIVSYASVDVVQKVLSGNKGVEVLFNYINQENRISAYLPVPQYQWGVVAFEPVTSAFAPRSRQMMHWAVIHVFMLLIMVLLSYSMLQVLDERRKRAQEAAKLNHEIEKRARDLEVVNNELESFSYSVSHDLRTPLSSIYGYAEILEEEHLAKMDNESIGLVASIRNAAARMESIINDLLQFSRQVSHPISYTAIDMNKLFEDTIQSLHKETAGRNIQFLVGELPRSRADLSMLSLVVQNLLHNAIKFTGKRSEAVIQVGGRVADSEVIYWIKDNGAGFDMKKAEKLFTPFLRLHSNADFEGTGIGLSIVARIIRRHGGRVWAYSKPQEGAEIYFSLPVANASSVVSPAT